MQMVAGVTQVLQLEDFFSQLFFFCCGHTTNTLQPSGTLWFKKNSLKVHHVASSPLKERPWFLVLWFSLNLDSL